MKNIKNTICLFLVLFCLVNASFAQDDISERFTSGTKQSIDLNRCYADVLAKIGNSASGLRYSLTAGNEFGPAGIKLVQSDKGKLQPDCAASALSAFRNALISATAKAAFIQSVNLTIDLATAGAKFMGASDLVKQLIKASTLSVAYWESNSPEEFQKKIFEQIQKQFWDYFKDTKFIDNLSGDLKDDFKAIIKNLPTGEQGVAIQKFLKDFDKSAEGYVSKSLVAIYTQMNSLKTRRILDNDNVNLLPCQQVKVHIWTSQDFESFNTSNGVEKFAMYIEARGKCFCKYPLELKDWYVKVTVPIINPQVVGKVPTAYFTNGSQTWQIIANCGCTQANTDSIPPEEHFQPPPINGSDGGQTKEPYIPKTPQQMYEIICEKRCHELNDSVMEMANNANLFIQMFNKITDSINERNSRIADLKNKILSLKEVMIKRYTDEINTLINEINNLNLKLYIRNTAPKMINNKLTDEQVKTIMNDITYKEKIKTSHQNILDGLKSNKPSAILDSATKKFKKSIQDITDTNQISKINLIKIDSDINYWKKNLLAVTERRDECAKQCNDEYIIGGGKKDSLIKPEYRKINEKTKVAIFVGFRVSNEDSKPRFNTSGAVVGGALQVAKKISVNTNIGITSGSNNGVKYNKTTIVAGGSFYPLGTNTNKNSEKLKVVPSVTAMVGTSTLKSSAGGYSSSANSFTYQLNGDVQFPLNTKILKSPANLFLSGGLLHTNFYATGQSNINIDAGIKLAFGK